MQCDDSTDADIRPFWRSIDGGVAMKAKRSIRFFAFTLLCASGWAQAQCTAPSNWFPHNQTPEPSTANPGTENCNFHQWSWQTFLWLTQKIDGDLRFITQMYSAEDSFSLEKSGSAFPKWAHRKKGPLVLRPRDTKPTDIRGEPGINQPGDNGVLVDQNNHPVYYAIHVNETYYDFMVERQYFDPSKLEAASSIDKFRVGTLEIKSSWQVVNDGDDTTRCYTTNAVLQPLEVEHKAVVVRPHKDLTVAPTKKVALVGLHIAGVVMGHPEFIWATFELRGNAPLLKPGASPDSAVSTSGRRFYAANRMVKECNQSNAGHVTIIDASKQTLEPITQVARVVESGGGTDTALVRGLNKDVKAQLDKEGDIAANYDLIGSLWVKDGNLEPNQIPGLPTSQMGSTRLANTTMETFRQAVGNCFSCHNTTRFKYEDVSLPALNLNLSHALRQTYVLNKQFHLKQMRLKTPKAPRK
jgi:hypothetical protein